VLIEFETDKDTLCTFLIFKEH